MPKATNQAMTEMTTTEKPARAERSSRAGRSTKQVRSGPRLLYVIGQLDRLLKRRLAEVLAGYGLTVPQFTALSVINAGGQMTNAQLAERSFVTPQSANEVVKAMEGLGWVAREGHPTHGRLIHLYLTDEGKSVLARCDAAIDRLEATMLEGIQGFPIDALKAALQHCASNLRI